LMLMTKNFFVPSLDKYPLLYTFLHQALALLIYAIPLLVAKSPLSGTVVAGFLVGTFSASFLFEVARKLETGTDKSLYMYPHLFGLKLTKTILLLSTLSLLFANYFLGTINIATPILAVMTICLYFYCVKNRARKALEGLSVLVNLFQLWVLLIGKVI
jgi:hypothetical protein